MNNFYVYEHPKYGRKIEKDGFSFLGFFFTIIWLLIKRLYKPALAFFLLFLIAATFADRVLPELMELRIEAIASMPQQELNEIYRYKEIYLQEIEPTNKALSVNEKLKLATKAYATDQEKYFKLAGICIWLVVLAAQLLIGFKGRSWVLSNLEKRGFALVEEVQAHTKDAVIAKVLKPNNEKVEIKCPNCEAVYSSQMAGSLCKCGMRLK